MVIYTLFFAPDNASLIVRVALEELGTAYETQLVDRGSQEQNSEAYRKLNPNGQIPVCIMDGEPVFETAAILLLLSERHGALAPAAGSPGRANWLKWFVYVGNTIHPSLQALFYQDKHVGSDLAAQRCLEDVTANRLKRQFEIIEAAYGRHDGPFLLGDALSIVDIYLGLCLRWPQLYPKKGLAIVEPERLPVLSRMLSALQGRTAVRRAFAAEGISTPYFLSPDYPDGSKGVAL